MVYQIKKHLLSTITNVESGRWNQRKQRNTAWPWTVNAQGEGHFYATKQQAINAVRSLQAKGVKSIDVGCMQINLAYHPDAFENLEEAFNPYKNMEYGARFLKKLYEQKKDWNKAATAYHSSVKEKAKKYAKKLSRVYKDIVQASLELKPVSKVANNSKKLENKKVFAKNKKVKNAKSIQVANAWREAKLAEYYMKKAKQL